MVILAVRAMAGDGWRWPAMAGRWLGELMGRRKDKTRKQAAVAWFEMTCIYLKMTCFWFLREDYNVFLMFF